MLHRVVLVVLLKFLCCLTFFPLLLSALRLNQPTRSPDGMVVYLTWTQDRGDPGIIALRFRCGSVIVPQIDHAQTSDFQASARPLIPVTGILPAPCQFDALDDTVNPPLLLASTTPFTSFPISVPPTTTAFPAIRTTTTSSLFTSVDSGPDFPLPEEGHSSIGRPHSFPSSRPPPTNYKGPRVSKAARVGGGVGGSALVVLAGGLCVWCCRRKNRRLAANATPPAPHPPESPSEAAQSNINYETPPLPHHPPIHSPPMTPAMQAYHPQEYYGHAGWVPQHREIDSEAAARGGDTTFRLFFN